MRAVTSIVPIVVALSTVPVTVSTQRTDFSGSWEAVKDVPPDMPAAPSPVLGPRMTLRLEGDTLTWIRPVRDDHVSMVLTLNGSKASARIPGRMCEGDSEAFETGVWENGAIVLTAAGVVPAGGGAPRPFTAKRVLKLQDPNTLVIQGIMNQSGKMVSVGTVYKRSDPMPPPNRKPPAAKGTPATIGQVAWIGALWSGENKTLTVEERWTPPASGGMIGVARTLRDAALASFEFLCIAERDGSLVYQAMPNGRSPATEFTLTAITETSATFENPAHDFPRLIRYSRQPDGSLQTAISAGPGQKETTFVLKKQP